MTPYNLIVTDLNGCQDTAATINVSLRYRPSDFNQDGLTNVADFLIFLQVFGQNCVACPEDLFSDGIINTSDYLLFIGEFGLPCQ